MKKLGIAVLVIIFIVGLGLWLIGSLTDPETTTGELSYERSREVALGNEAARVKFWWQLASTNHELVTEGSAKPAPRRFKSTDLKLAMSSPPVNLREYAIAVAQILKAINRPRPNEASLVLEAIDRSPTAEAELRASLATHQNTLKNLLAVTVPSQATQEHLQLVNSLASLINLLEAMSLTAQKPVVALEAARHYQTAYPEWLLAIDQLNILFAKQQITLSPNERRQTLVN